MIHLIKESIAWIMLLVSEENNDLSHLIKHCSLAGEK